MMKEEDKEKVLPKDPDDDLGKLPKIEVYSNKALNTTRKPWFPGFIGLVIGFLAIIVSIGVMVTCLRYLNQVFIRNRFILAWRKSSLPG